MRYLLLLSVFVVSAARADGVGIDKVYHPYVQPLERELEWRMISADGEQNYRLGLGASVSDKWFVEVYLIADDSNTENLDIIEYELEAKYQITEQGEYSIDWGVITELEKSRKDDDWEFSTGLLMEKQWGRYSGTANFKLIYEWGETIDSELESALAVQLRYRYSRQFEPAIELYSAENTRAIGPVAMGDVKFTGRKKLHWETGIIFGLDDKTPDTTLRLLSEFEF